MVRCIRGVQLFPGGLLHGQVMCMQDLAFETLSFHDYCSFHKGPVLQTTVTSSNRIHVGRHPSPCFAAPQCARVKANSTSPSSCSPRSSFQYLWGFVPEPSLGFLCGGRCRFFRVLYCLQVPHRLTSQIPPAQLGSLVVPKSAVLVREFAAR